MVARSTMSKWHELQLAGPLFLAALMISVQIYYHGDRSVLAGGPTPPVLQSMLGYCHDNCKPSQRQRRRRTALAAVFLLCDIFQATGVEIPCGRRPSSGRPGCLDKEPTWLLRLHRADPTAALLALNRSANTLCDRVCYRVEDEYNKCCERYGYTRLEPGELGTLFASLRPVQTTVERIVSCTEPCSSQRRTYFYIAAGIGCGMKQIEQVRSMAL